LDGFRNDFHCQRIFGSHIHDGFLNTDGICADRHSFQHLVRVALQNRSIHIRARIAFIEKAKAPGVLGGILLQAINPKAYAVNTAFFSGFAFWPASAAVETLLKFAIINAIWVPIHFLWLGAGVLLRRLELPRPVQVLINVIMALSMLAVVALAALAPH